MRSQLEITKQVIQKIARKAGYTLQLRPPMALTDSPLSLNDTKIRRLTINLRNMVKDDRPEVSLMKTEVVDAKTVRGVVQLIVKKIRNTVLSNSEADDLIGKAQT